VPQGAASGIRELSATAFKLNTKKGAEEGLNITVGIAKRFKWEVFWTTSGYDFLYSP
jgi:hypothetical protein